MLKRAREKLRKSPLPKRTSTYVEGSPRQAQGSGAELKARDWLQEQLNLSYKAWTVLLRRDARIIPFGGCGPVSDYDPSWEPINNSRDGDLYVYRDRTSYFGEPTFLFSVEVKSSDRWPSIAINYSELFQGQSRYLMGVTTRGTWICSMDEARKHCELKETFDSSFYRVDPNGLKLLTIKEIINAQERPADVPSDPDAHDGIPF